MKKTILRALMVVMSAGMLTSCYTQSYMVGNGPQTGLEAKERSHYLVYGLAPIKTADPAKMAGESKDYQVTVQHTFVDGLINVLTAGIYTPTTTTIVK